MHLRELAARIPDTEILGHGDPGLIGLTSDSREVKPGFLFAALPGTKLDGAAYINDAIKNGATAVIASFIPTLPPDIPCLIAPDARLALGLAADIFYEQPSHQLQLLGVTGTNGKTTTAYLLRHLLNSAGQRCGMLGTIEYDLGNKLEPAPLTTPDAVRFTRSLAEMRDFGCRAAVVEVSSHALDQDRVHPHRFKGAVFTNLTRDHLDYHGDMSAYLEAKRRLFLALPPDAVAVFNYRDPAATRMAEGCKAKRVGYVLLDQAVQAAASNPETESSETVNAEPVNAEPVDAEPVNAGPVGAEAPITEAAGIGDKTAKPNPAVNPAANPAGVAAAGTGAPAVLVTASITASDLRGQSFHLQGPNLELDFHTPLVGRHNVENCLGAVLLALHLGLGSHTVAKALASFPGVPGRLERLESVTGVTAFVDYAHTDDALRSVLSVLRPLVQGKLITVFGCGGDRDPGKRPLMAKAAEAFSDTIIVTSDNPRTEDPDAILNAIMAGFANPRAVIRERDRPAAVRRAVALAGPRDTILVAGKGHENYQIIGTEKHHLDDRELVREAFHAI